MGRARHRTTQPVRGDTSGLRQQPSPAVPGVRVLMIEETAKDLTTQSRPAGQQFRERLGARLARTSAGQDHPAVLVLDIDRFRAINDSFGRSLGDYLLVAVASRLSDVVDAQGALAHLGGDEFAIMLDRCRDAAHALSFTQTIQDAFRAPFVFDDREVYASVSIGVALGGLEAGYRTPDQCLRDADTAMYHAKSSGRGGHVVFTRDMRTDRDAAHHLEHDLRRAVARHEFEVHYQPIVSFVDGAIEGFEALVRWRHSDRGLIYPDSFIPMAEQTGLIVPIGWMVLEEACRALSSWREQCHGEPFVSVNFSGQQFMQPNVVDRVERVLEATGCRAGDLRIELTETMVMEPASVGVETLRRLSDLGVQLYLDDFGTGYSSLSHLHRLPTHALKIDRSFVSQVIGRPEIIGAILALAQDLDMRVEAEGVETSHQLRCLRELGCEFGQGFYFSRPVPSGAAAGLVDTNLTH